MSGESIVQGAMFCASVPHVIRHVSWLTPLSLWLDFPNRAVQLEMHFQNVFQAAAVMP